MNQIDRFRGCLIGLACGDAIGTTVEFCPRDTFRPVTDMVGGGVFELEAGQWTDDTSMALCLAESLIEKREFDAEDQMRRYLDWYHNGKWSCTNECFDIGNTVQEALQHFESTGNPVAGLHDPNRSGNGAIMRLAPIAMAYCNDLSSAVHYSICMSHTTHGSDECLDAAALFGAKLWAALNKNTKNEILFNTDYFPSTKSIK